MVAVAVAASNRLAAEAGLDRVLVEGAPDEGIQARGGLDAWRAERRSDRGDHGLAGVGMREQRRDLGAERRLVPADAIQKGATFRRG